MSQIRINTEQVRAVGHQMRAKSERILQIGNELRRAIFELSTEGWDGAARAQTEPRLNQVYKRGTHIAQELDHLGTLLIKIAAKFAKEDAKAASNLSQMPWVSFEKGKVLGVMMNFAQNMPTASMSVLASMPLSKLLLPKPFSEMTWVERLEYVKEIEKHLGDYKSQHETLEEQIIADESELEKLNKQINNLGNQRALVQDEAQKLGNKILPGKLGIGFDDGIIDAPWRTKSDDLEDEINRYDQQLQDLYEQRQSIIEQRNQHQADLNELDSEIEELESRQSELNKIVETGIDESETPAWLQKHLTGCTNYVSQRRDVSEFNGGHPGNASEWNEQARAYGYEVGSQPVKGSIVVWEPNANYTIDSTGDTFPVHESAGHVAIVESVDQSGPDVIRIQISHAGLPSDGITGTHSAPTTEWITLDADEIANEDISFIYDQIPQDLQKV